jgi:hypothetical protein
MQMMQDSETDNITRINDFVIIINNSKMPGAGFEPARPFDHRILSPMRLPFRHPGINFALPQIDIHILSPGKKASLF